MSGRAPAHHVLRPLPWELPPFSAYVVCPLFFSIAVTNSLLFPALAVFAPLPPWNRPFSMSASTQGPLPVHGEKKHVVLRLTASMCQLPLSSVFVSALPKSKQQPLLTCVPLATMYILSGWPLTAIPRVLLSR